MITIDSEVCVACGGCIDLCPTTAIRMIDDVVRIDQDLCSGCRICVQVCPVSAPHECDDNG